MKKIFSVFLLLFLGMQVYGQSKFSIGYVNSYELSFYKDQHARLAYTIGFNFRYQLSSNTNITSGIQYSVKGFSSHVDFTDPNNNSLGTSLINYSFKFIEIPLLLSCQSKSSNKISLYTSAGFVPGYFMSLKAHGFPVTGTVKINQEDLNKNYNRFIINGFLGMGGMVKLSEKFKLLIQPNFKYSLTKLDKPFNPIPAMGIFPINYHLQNYHPYSIGILLGVFYQL